LPETNALRPGRRARAADLHLGAVDPQLDTLSVSVGEQVLQRAQPNSGTVRGGEASGRQQRADLADRPGDGGTVHRVQLRQRHVRQPQPQVNEGDQEPVGEHHALLGTRTSGPAPGPAASFTQRRLPDGLPLGGEFFDQLAEMCAGEARQGRMGTGRTGPASLHNLLNPCGRCPVTVTSLLPPGAAPGRRPATGRERGRARSSLSSPVRRPASTDDRSGLSGVACRAGAGWWSANAVKSSSPCSAAW
jgi:hypothetical protein